ncbi:hypothetical protein HaLaN_19309, partial [Haematococcus lacustris]
MGRCMGIEGERPGPVLLLLEPAAAGTKQWQGAMTVVVSTSKRGVQLSTKALELVPGQMKTDKQAVFKNAAEGLAQHLKRRQAVTQLQAVVVSTSGKKGVMLSTKTLELVPGQMKSDKQAVFANAAEGLAQHLAKKKEFMDQRRQALSHLQVGSVVTGTAKVKRTDGWVVALDGMSAVVRWYNLSKDLIRGQSVQILITEIRLESAKAFATTRFEQKPDGTYQILPRFPAKSTEKTAAAKPAAEPAAKPAAEPAAKPAAEPAAEPTTPGHPRHWPRNSLFGTVFDPLRVILPPLGSTSHSGVACRHFRAEQPLLPLDWQLANASKASTGRCVLGCFEDQPQIHISPKLSQALVQLGNQTLKPVPWRMPSTYYHPYLNSPTARDEPDARLCAVCGLTCAAKNRDGFVKVHRVGEDACHGRYQ